MNALWSSCEVSDRLLGDVGNHHPDPLLSLRCLGVEASSVVPEIHSLVTLLTIIRNPLENEFLLLFVSLFQEHVNNANSYCLYSYIDSVAFSISIGREG